MLRRHALHVNFNGGDISKVTFTTAMVPKAQYSHWWNNENIDLKTISH